MATKVFDYSVPNLKQAGIEEYLLDVLHHNTAAVSVYQKIGFEVSRKFYYFRPEINQIQNHVKAIGFPYPIRPMDLNRYDSIPSSWDFKLFWQNSMESVNRSPESFTSLGIFTEDRLIGYAVLEPASGDITHIAVNKLYSHKGISSLLIIC